MRFLTLLIPAGFERCFPDLDAPLAGGTPCAPVTIALRLARYDVQVEGAAAFGQRD